MLDKKAKVFVIMPFDEEHFELYKYLKEIFVQEYEFNHAGDLDSQRNILTDIVKGIYEADVIIADVSGLNANVFYELGLAHAMNKKVIIITQNQDELPFDIVSYKANEYSLLFYKTPALIERLKELLKGAVDETITYGNPVSDMMPDYFLKKKANGMNKEHNTIKNEMLEDKESIETPGFLDNIASIEENSEIVTTEIENMAVEMEEMTEAVNKASEDIKRVNKSGNQTNTAYVRNICRKLANPIKEYAEKVSMHVNKVDRSWGIIENEYLSLLDNKYATESENVKSLKESIELLPGLKQEIVTSNESIAAFIDVLYSSKGIERRLNGAVSNLCTELEGYLSLTNKMISSIDRITTKAEVVL